MSIELCNEPKLRVQMLLISKPHVDSSPKLAELVLIENVVVELQLKVWVGFYVITIDWIFLKF